LLSNRCICRYGHVDLKYLSENVSSLGVTQNLSGFGIEVYKNFKKETDGDNYVSYIGLPE